MYQVSEFGQVISIRLLVVISFVAVSSFASSASGLEKDIAYGSDPSQRLDLSTPSTKGFPTVIFVHGGSLSSGDKSDNDYKDVCSSFPAAGIACANINYRLAPANRWPAPGDDVAAAVAWVAKNIGSRGGDPAKLFLFGHSSGAALVALVGSDERYLVKFGLKTNAIAGVIPMGSIMWDDIVEQAVAKSGRQVVEQNFARRADFSMWGSLDTYQSYWPFNHLHASMPPYLFLIAESEQINPPILMTNSKFVEKSRSLGNTADYQVIPGRTHYSNIRRISEKDDAAFTLVRDFVRKFSANVKKPN